MVQPFDYSIDALNPVDAMLGGMAFNQQTRINEQGMALAQSQEQRAQTAFEQSNLLFDQQQQDRAAGMEKARLMNADLAALSEKIAGGDYSSQDFAAISAKYPDLVDEMSKMWEGVDAERKQTDVAQLFKGVSAIKAGRPDLAIQMLEDRAVAAENSGDKMEADIARATAAAIKADPAAGLTSLGLLLQTVDPEAAKSIFGEGSEKPAGVVELEWRAKEAGLVPGTKEYQDFIARDGKPLPSSGTTTIGPDGTITVARSADGTPKVGVSVAEIQTSVQAATDLIDQIANDPALPGVTGALEGGGGNNVDEFSMPRRAYYGDAGLGVIQKIAQLQNTAWLAARDMLKGGGAITDYESKKAEGAMARLSRAQGDKEFLAALKDLRDAITEGARKLQEASGEVAGSGSPQPPAGEPTLDDLLREAEGL